MVVEEVKTKKTLRGTVLNCLATVKGLSSRKIKVKHFYRHKPKYKNPHRILEGGLGTFTSSPTIFKKIIYHRSFVK